jgi:predicted phosphohydrolase|eukprot:Stramenopile-MAST_4_protein_428
MDTLLKKVKGIATSSASFSLASIRPLYMRVRKLLKENAPTEVTDAAADQLLSVWLGTETYSTGTYVYVPPYSKVGTLSTSRVPKPPGSIRIVIVSDTHERHGLLDIPDGDVLLHTGDFLMMNPLFSTARSLEKMREFNEWLGRLPHAEKILIGGNHDKILETLGKDASQEILSNCTYLENDFVELSCGISVFGTPASKRNSAFSPNDAFQYSVADLKDIVRAAPLKCDVFMCHGPPDSLPPVMEYIETNPESPQLCIFGHIHERHGVEVFGDNGRIVLGLNGAVLGQGFHPSRAPIVHDFIPKTSRTSKL